MTSSSSIVNVWNSLSFQLGLSGDLPARMAFAAAYWWKYLLARRGAPQADALTAHGIAMRQLILDGRSRRIVRLSTPRGLSLEVDLATAFFILRETLSDGIYHACELDDFVPRPGDTVLDIGGQQGCFAVLAASQVGPSGKVFTFEPEPGNYALLAGNIARNGFRNVKTLPCAVSDSEGQAELFIDECNSGGHSLDPRRGGKSVPVRTIPLDGMLAEFAPPPALIKIDVEGSAGKVLEGAKALLERWRPKIVLEVHDPQEESAVRELLLRLGYELRRVDNNLFASATPGLKPQGRP